MINRDDIEAGDKVYTRDGGCLVARKIRGKIYVTGHSLACWDERCLMKSSNSPNDLDIIRIEKAPKPVVREIYVGTDSLAAYVTCEEYVPTFASVFKLTIINGKLEKSEQMK